MATDEYRSTDRNHSASGVERKASGKTMPPSSPLIPPVNLAKLPSYLKQFGHFVTWHYEFDAEADEAKGQKRWRKLPTDADGTGRHARSNDPSTWRTYDRATETYLRQWRPERGNVGLGFVLVNVGPRYPKIAPEDADDVVFVDLDHCRDPETGKLTERAEEILHRFHTYAEVSPSGTGVHLYLRGSLARSFKTAEVEIYAAGRFTTLTGQHVEESPAEIAVAQEALDWLVGSLESDVAASLDGVYGETRGVFERQYEPVSLSDEELLDRIRRSEQGEKFRQLYDDGDWESLFASQSEAVASLVSMLAFWTRKDAERIDSLFCTSALCSGKWSHKWDDLRGDVTLGVCEMASAFALIGEEVYWGDQGGSHDNDRRRHGPRTLGDALDDQQQRSHSSAASGISHSKRKEAKAKKWPEPMADAAYYGVLGEIVRETEPYIEADSGALLVHWIVASGVALGHGPYLQVGADPHYGVLYSVVVGHTSDNKSNSLSPIRRVVTEAQRPDTFAHPLDVTDPLPWTTGLSTGEGLLWQVRDELTRLVPDAKTHELKEQVIYEGISDKRLLVFASEFAAVLTVMYREGNTLSPTLRELFDCPEQARSSPKNNPIVVTAPHIGLIGMITPDELRRKLREGEVSNGFVGRLVWPLTHRIKTLDDPPDYSDRAKEHAERWMRALQAGRAIGRLYRDEAAQDQWRDLYPQLREGTLSGLPTREGLAREACARSHVMVLRIALIFAALDGSDMIRTEHQTAALGVWEYCERCAAYFFSDVMNSSVATTILDALQSRGRLTRNDLVNLFSRHVTAPLLQAGLDELVASGKVRSTREATCGRPVEYWELTRGSAGEEE